MLAMLSIMSQPVLADPRDEDGIDRVIESGSSSEASTPTPRPAISIQKPVGTIVISRAGDELGAIRYGNRTESGSIQVVSFSRSVRGAAAPSIPLSFRPTTAPLQNARLTSNFGYRRDPMTGRSKWHSGLDLAAPTGTPIMATSDGMVSTAGWKGGYGIAVVIDHGNGVQTLYGHMSQMTVQSGERVLAGQVIGLVGSTGRSTGPHLHYEIRKNGSPIQPFVN